MRTSASQPLPRVVRSHRAAVANLEPVEPFWASIGIRIATVGDQPSLDRLAELDSAARPSGTWLIAVVGDRVVAALSLGDGNEIADPFVATTDVLELLRLRARQLSSSGRRGRGRLRPAG